jgi:peptidoglycan/LPS O-acetylase OafA/YrhL
MDYLRRKVAISWRQIGNSAASSEYFLLQVSETTDSTSNSLSPEDDAEITQTEAQVAFKEGFPTSTGFFTNFLSRNPTARTFLVALSPSFFHPPPNKTYKTLHPTDWLNGLRGVASLMVVFHHSSLLCYPEIMHGWGSTPQNRLFVQLPLIRIFHSGSAMVAIFFIVSGFSLSYKPLKLIRNTRFPEVLDSLSSSVFRRQLRLILPAAAVTFFSMIATYVGWYGTGNPRQPPQFATLLENIANWVHSVRELADPFRPVVYPNGYNPIYDTNLWTIPVEFHGSMVIFLLLLGLARVYTPVRLLVLATTVLYLLYFAYTHLFLFISGVLLADLHHVREEYRKTRSPIEPQRDLGSPDADPAMLTRQSLGIKAFWLSNFLLAIFVASMPLIPYGARTSPGYITLASWIPPNYRAPFVEDHFWIFLAAVHLVLTVDNAKFLQSIFTTSFAQYLGKISFALYLLHGTFLFTLGWNLYPKMLGFTGGEAGFQYAFGGLLTGCVLYPLLFWVSDVVARLVDVRSVAFARWLYVKVSVDI